VRLRALPAALLLAQPVSAAPRTYTIVGEKSQVLVEVGRAGLFKIAGHEHQVAATDVTGEVVADPANLAGSSVQLVFRAAALAVVGNEDPADRPKVQEAMASPRVLDVGRFPEIRFSSQTVKGRQGADQAFELTIDGTLELHGVTKPLSFPVRVTLDGDTLVAEGKLAVRQTAFGIEPVSVGGVVKVKDELAIACRFVARAAP
jgi:polyisoprenoid-binding protein YceI